MLLKENKGKSDSLNIGINYCHGEYIVCIDADSCLNNNAISCIADIIKNHEDVVALGGSVIPKAGIFDYVFNSNYCFKDILQSYQELEYGKAFNIVRTLFNKMDTTMLLSGTISIFKKDLLIELGSYSLDTVAEDMEIVMRIRQYIANTNKPLKISYVKDIICYTEVPWNVSDLIKQRIRWTFGLYQVLWKYKEILYKDCYTFKEKIAYCYYLLFELLSPFIELIGIVSILLYDLTNTIILLFVITLIIQIVLSIVGSYKSIKDSIELSKNKIKTIIKLSYLLISFVSIYHFIYSFVRLISIPYYKIKNRNNNSNGNKWISPKRK